jgi:hypothetical protein
MSVAQQRFRVVNTAKVTISLRCVSLHAFVKQETFASFGHTIVLFFCSGINSLQQGLGVRTEVWGPVVRSLRQGLSTLPRQRHPMHRAPYLCYAPCVRLCTLQQTLFATCRWLLLHLAAIGPLCNLKLTSIPFMFSSNGNRYGRSRLDIHNHLCQYSRSLMPVRTGGVHVG